MKYIWGRLGLGGMALVTALFMANSAKAATIMDTMDSPITSETDFFTRSNTSYGFKFTTGSQAETVRSIDVLINDTSQPNEWQYVQMAIYAADGAGSAPSTMLGTFSLYDLDSTSVFGTPDSSVNLNASTSYWLVFAPVGTQGANASYATTSSPAYSSDTVSGYQFVRGAMAYYNFSTSTWSTLSFNAAPLVKLDTTAVPEPSGLALVALGAAAAVILLRKRSFRHG